MKKMVVALLIIFAVIGVSFLIAPSVKRPNIEVVAACCPIKDETGTGLVGPGR
jgi:hypothetical protein